METTATTTESEPVAAPIQRIVRERAMEAEFLLLTGDIAPTIERAIVDGDCRDRALR